MAAPLLTTLIPARLERLPWGRFHTLVVAAPFIFGKLIASGSRDSVFAGYAVAAALMLGAALVAALFAVRAERKSLEEVATPLSADA